MKLPEQYLERMQAQLGEAFPRYLQAMEEPPKRGLRVNTLKVSPEAFCRKSPWELAPSGVMAEGFLLGQAQVGLAPGQHPYHAAGAYYLQEPSAMTPVELLNPQPGMRILDLCAAPGGKSGAAAARLLGKGLLVANEINPGRARILSGNLERLGVTNSVVTDVNPEALCQALPGYFDGVLVDAPCSGEGMFRKDPAAVQEWSAEHVTACANRQGLILKSAAQTVRPGGVLVYSTCTFAPEENEGVVEAFLKQNPGFCLEEQRRLYPQDGIGEGHFAARLRRVEGEEPREQGLWQPAFCREQAALDFLRETLDVLPERPLVELKNGDLALWPMEVPKGLERLHCIKAGVTAGRMEKGRFEPSHTFFLSAGLGGFAQPVEADFAAALRFLQGETLTIPETMKGWRPVCFDGLCLGFGKAVQGMLKNHLPKGLRMRFREKG